MTPRRLLAFLLFGVLLLLTPVAYALPPDPSWLGGFYDDDDYDEISGKIVSTVGAIDVVPGRQTRPLLGLSAFLGLGHDGPPSRPAAAPYQTRAPPSS